MTKQLRRALTGTEFQQNFARRLRLARGKAGFTRRQLAYLFEPDLDVVAVSQRIYKYEVGKTQVPLFSAWRLASALGVELSELCAKGPEESGKDR